MSNTRILQRAVRYALATATAAASVSALHAQEAPAPAAAPAPVEEVVVTGSRLQTPNETSVSPITSVSAVDLQQTGLTRVEDVLNNLPMVFAGMNSTTSNGADGTATVDLRGLGNQRTLVLVDGLRLGPGTSIGGRNFSDINQIPAALIERVDVLTGGASAVYGADAVAGVVNFILKTHFEGIKVEAGYHFNSTTTTTRTAGVAGHRRGRSAAERQRQHRLRQADLRHHGIELRRQQRQRDRLRHLRQPGAALQSKFDYSACSLGPEFRQQRADVRGLGHRGARRRRRRIPRLSGNGGTGRIDHTVDGATGQFRPFGAQDLYNFGPLNYYQTPNERWTAGTFINYDMNSHMNVYANVMYKRKRGLRRSQPAATSSTPHSSRAPIRC